MAIKFRKKAIKFLDKANPEDVENIREQINQISVAVEELKDVLKVWKGIICHSEWSFAERRILSLAYILRCFVPQHDIERDFSNNLLGVIPFTELDIKKIKGDWEGFYRLRVGKNRIIFTIDVDSNDIEIYAIGARGNIYKQ